LLGGLSDDGRHSILDVGPASGAHLSFLGTFARRIRFAALVPAECPVPGDAVREALLPLPDRPYDVVLAWDLLDHLDDAERPGLIQHLAMITAPGARLYAVVSSSESVVRPVHSTIVDPDHVSMVPAGRPRPSQPLLPAAVERLLSPFGVTHAFTLRVGLREYVAFKPER